MRFSLLAHPTAQLNIFSIWAKDQAKPQSMLNAELQKITSWAALRRW